MDDLDFDGTVKPSPSKKKNGTTKSNRAKNNIVEKTKSEQTNLETVLTIPLKKRRLMMFEEEQRVRLEANNNAWANS